MEKPTIMLIDFPDETQKSFTERGYNVASGTFGKIYDITESIKPVVPLYYLPKIQEKDIILINLPGYGRGKVNGEFEKNNKEGDYIILPFEGADNLNTAIINMSILSSEIFKIISAGRIVVCFSNHVVRERWRTGTYPPSYYNMRERSANNYSWLSNMGPYVENILYGDQILLKTPEDTYLHSFFSKFEKDFIYHVDLSGLWDKLILAENPVGNEISIRTQIGKGYVFFLPYTDKINDISFYFVDEVLSRIFPALFPEKETRSWILKDEYHTPTVRELKTELEEALVVYRKDITAKEATIEQEKEKTIFLRELLTAQNDELKQAVMKTFKYLGCDNVIDVDTNLPEGALPREDISFLYEGELRLVEVKGSIRNARDSHVQTVGKYLLIARKEKRGTEPTGILIFNNERQKEPKDRNPAFTETQIKLALEQDITLIAAPDLFDAIMLEIGNKCTKADILSALCEPGLFRIETIKLG